ncbi:MAG: sodium transporter [Acidobacteria bacterium]|nr:MAG: sodium transporter [Acidobacteriota bacterium]
MSGSRWIDLMVVVAYMAGMTYLGLRFARRQTSTEHYFVAKRSIPAWALGMSLFATIISSVTFIGYPGSAYAKDWSNLVPGFMLLVCLFVVGSVLIPFYREVVGISAYEYFGKRFGVPVRLYSSFAFSLGHFSKMGLIIYLVALVISGMTGWNLYWVMVSVGLVTIYYSVIGGLEAVIWADVIQGFVMFAGIFVCLGYLLFLAPGGPVAPILIAWNSGKFSLGSMSPDLSKPTILVLVLYGLFWYLQKYSADQTIVQRYLVARNHREAMRGVSLGAYLSFAVWTLFMLIGSLVWAYYKLTGEALPASVTKADAVFPHFLTTHIPVGLAGLFIASLLAAAMSTLASDLNCLAVVAVEDFYRRFRPDSTDQQRLRTGKLVVAVAGALAVGTGILLAQTGGGALSMWFAISSIVSGGLAGLFLLAFLSTRANRKGATAGIVASVASTAWGTLTLGSNRTLDLGALNFPYHELMIGVIGHVVLLVVGYLVSLVTARDTGEHDPALTIWGWLQRRKAPAATGNART